MSERPDAADNARLARANGLVASEVDGEVVILSIDRGSFFQLNTTGSRIWNQLEAPKTIAEICEDARTRFAVDEEACRRDVTEFAQEMLARGLLQRA